MRSSWRGSVRASRGRAEHSPLVGAVAVDANRDFIADGYHGQDGPGDHAEFCLIKHVGVGSGGLRGATVYTTLEPCTTRNPAKIPCAQRLIDEGVAVVYIGMLDPDARIRERGWSALRDAGIEFRDFTRELRDQIESLNAPFVERFQVATATERLR